MTLSDIREFSAKHWHELALFGAIIVAYAAGRWSAPTHVETKTETKTVYQDRVVEKRVEVQAEAKVVYRDRSVITHADGTVEHRDVKRDSDVTKDTHAYVRAETRVETRDVVTTKLVTRDAPRLSVSALIGLGPSARLVYGGAIQYRVLGPIAVGAWALTAPAGGLSISLQF